MGSFSCRAFSFLRETQQLSPTLLVHVMQQCTADIL